MSQLLFPFLKNTGSNEWHPSYNETFLISCWDDTEWKSEIFQNPYSSTKWYIELCLTRRVCVYLCHLAFHEEEIVEASFMFGLQPIGLNNVKILEQKSMTFKGNKQGVQDCYGSEIGDRLLLHVDITEKIKNFSIKSPHQLFASEVFRLWEDRKLCDFIISVEETDLAVHRVILAAASPFFAAMLENDMLEKRTNKMVIIDYNVEVIRPLLQFLYTRDDSCFKCLELSLCLDLLRAATQYCLRAAVQTISQHLVSILDIENVVEILLVAEQQQVPDLKEKVLQFFCGLGAKVPEVKNFEQLDRKVDIWKEISLKYLEKPE